MAARLQKANVIETIWRLPDNLSKQSYSLFTCKVAAGFPSPTDDTVDQSLDLNEYLINNPTSTFFLRVKGNSMSGAGIHDGDVLVVDRSITPVDGKIVIAVVNGETTVKRLKINQGAQGHATAWLLPENPDYKPIKITPEMAFTVWGVVTSIVRKL